MKPSTFREELAGRFGWKLGETEEKETRLYLNPKREIFEDLIDVLYEENGARLATISCLDEEDEFRLLYHFALDEHEIMITVKLPVEKSDAPSTKSIANKIPGAEWIEREVREMFGIDFEDHPAKKRLLKADSLEDGDFPFRKDFKVEDLEGD